MRRDVFEQVDAIEIHRPRIFNNDLKRDIEVGSVRDQPTDRLRRHDVCDFKRRRSIIIDARTIDVGLAALVGDRDDRGVEVRAVSRNIGLVIEQLRSIVELIGINDDVERELERLARIEQLVRLGRIDHVCRSIANPRRVERGSDSSERTDRGDARRVDGHERVAIPGRDVVEQRQIRERHRAFVSHTDRYRNGELTGRNFGRRAMCFLRTDLWNLQRRAVVGSSGSVVVVGVRAVVRKIAGRIAVVVFARCNRLVVEVIGRSGISRQRVDAGGEQNRETIAGSQSPRDSVKQIRVAGRREVAVPRWIERRQTRAR